MIATARDRSGVRPADLWAAVARLIDLLGTHQFERELYSTAAMLAPLSVLFAFELGDAGTAGRVLVTEGRDEDLTARARKISRDYAEFDYALDEVLIKHNQGPPGATDLVRQYAKDREENFRIKYFDNISAAEEISVFSRSVGSTLYVGFSASVAGFSASEVVAIQEISPVLISLIRRHTALVDASGTDIKQLRERRLATLRRVLSQHEAGLTVREAEVCAAIVIGYRAEAIADLLGISPLTVATHRKRAYAKLGISSQTELFGIFFAAWFS